MLKQQVDYWLNQVQNDLGCFDDIEYARGMLYAMSDSGSLHINELDGARGVSACAIFRGLKGDWTCQEVLIYIKPEFRGDVRLAVKLIKWFEVIAKEKGCTSVSVGASIGYKDDSVLRLYKRLGYESSSLKKEI